MLHVLICRAIRVTVVKQCWCQLFVLPPPCAVLFALVPNLRTRCALHRFEDLHRPQTCAQPHPHTASPDTGTLTTWL